MGYSSQSGQIVVATQTAPGTPVSPAVLASDGLSLRLRSGSLGPERELIYADPEIGGGRDTSDGQLGGVKFAGEYDAYVRFETVAFFLANVLGAKATVAVSGATGAFEHTITPVDGQPPFITVYEQISNGLERFIFSDAVVNTFHLEVGGTNELLSMTAGLIARNITPNAAAISTNTLQDLSATVAGTAVKLRYAGEQLPAKSFTLDINNNFVDDNHVLGSFYLDDLTAQAREITASATIQHKNSRAFRQALFGTPTATEIGGVTTKEPLEIEITSFESIPGVTPATKYSLTLELPKVAIEPFAYAPSGADALENDLAMRALRPDTAVPVMSAVVVNGSEEIA